jgi:hypothetical protein
LFFRVLEYDFPLPPASASSPPAQSSFTFMAEPSAMAEYPQLSPTPPLVSDNFATSNDPARVHPTFIKSDLQPERGPFYPLEGEYPVDRLNPACIGYFNHVEYELAMATIAAAESLCGQNLTPTISISPPASENTVQYRRSTSASPYVRC